MPIKIAANQSAVAYHVVDGPVTFPYSVDAHMAVQHHPLEWSADPWSQEDENAARGRLNERAKEEGREPLPEPIEMTPEEKTALDEYNKATAEAKDRLKKFHEEQAEKKKVADQIAADEALVATPPPRPDPNARRPMSPAQIRKNAAMTDEERVDREKTGSELPFIDRDRAAREKALREGTGRGQSIQDAAKETNERIVREKAEQDRLAGANVTQTF
ncbi:MAG TPA: hypothetical protein VIM11_26660 [Tepidisphaeraceae bacterium]|jgi:hypothetical protein